MAFTLFIGEIDVSVGSNLGLVAAVVGTMLRDGQPLIAAVVVGIAIGAAIGLINAWGVAVMKAPSLIFTLGVNGILRGIIYVYTNGAWVENLPKSFKDFSAVTGIGDLTVYYCAVIALVVIIHMMLTRLVGAVGLRRLETMQTALHSWAFRRFVPRFWHMCCVACLLQWEESFSAVVLVL